MPRDHSSSVANGIPVGAFSKYINKQKIESELRKIPIRIANPSPFDMPAQKHRGYDMKWAEIETVRVLVHQLLLPIPAATSATMFGY